MYQTNQAFLEAMDDISRTLAVQVEIGGELYPTESIIDFELERGAFDGDVFTIGQTLSSALTLTIFTTSTIKPGDKVKLFTDLLVGGSYVRVPMGVYYVDSTSINQEKMKLMCYDKMVSLVGEYIPSGQHQTLSALFNDVRTQIGMTYDGAFTDVEIKGPLYGYTYRETLGFIASLNGGNMIINRSGNLEIKGYQAVERCIPAKTCFSFDVKEPYRVSKVFCQFGDAGVTRGDSSGQCVAFENPYVTEQNIDVIYRRLNGLRFTAGSLKYRGDLTLDPGDLFTFTDYKGDNHVLVCARNKLTFNGGLSGQLASVGESEKANHYTESQLKYKKNLTKVTAELGKIQAVVQEIEQSHDGLEERVKNAELEMTADAITSKIKDTFVSKDEAGNLVTQEQLTSAIRQTSNDITLQVSSNYETKQNVTTKVNSAISTAASDAQTKANSALSSAKSYADTKKTEAINTASTDATNKANNAKNEAINSANNTLTTTIANYYTKAQTDSAINIAKEAIDLSVSTNYETKENVETKINNISVGGRNYVRDYMFRKQDVWKRNRTSESFIDTDNGYGYLTSSTAKPFLYQIMPFNVFKKGQVVTIQYEIKCEDVSKNTSSDSMLIRTQLSGYESDSSGYIKDVCILGTHENEVANLTSWTKKTITRTIGDIGAAKSIWLRLYARNFTGKIYFRNVKLELGTKATDLSPAPEDIDSEINNKANTADVYKKSEVYTKDETNSQINVAKNAITQSVSSTYATKTDVTSSINGVNSSISNLQNRMNSAEQKITDTAITNTVKQNFYTKQETENAITSKGYATQSQVQQTADNIQFKFTQTGGYNLIRNGNPKPNNYSHWWVSGNANWFLGSADIGVQTLDTNEAYAGSATFKVEPGKTYSFSCWLMAESNTAGTDVYFIGSENDDGAYTDVHNLYTSSSGDQTWHQVKASFTVGSNINYGFIRIDNNGRKDTSNGAFTVVFFSEVMLVKGQDYFPQWSPNPNEVYDGITTIDKSGINVSASNINGYTKMTANGFFVNKDGKDLVSVDGYGLRLFDAKIQLTHANGNKYFLLDENGIVMYNPANGTHQWGKVAAINNKFTVASNGNSSGLSLGHHVNDNYVEDILCDSNGVVSVQRQMNHNGVFYNNYGQVFIRQSGQGGWEITGRSDSQSIKPGGANQGAVGSNTQYINQSWIANRYNPSSLEIKHLSHYVDDLECLKLVSEVQPARYFYKEYDEDGNDITTFTTRTSQLGLIYEDVRECTGRDLITNEEDKAINLYNMVSTLWGAVRNLNQRLNELEIENLKLNNELDQIKATQKEAK